AWLPPSFKQDYCFVFGPDGCLRTNDLTTFDGSVHLLVANGVEFVSTGPPPGSPSVTPGPAYFLPVRLGSPWTVSVTPLGEVEVRRGVSAGSVPEATSVPSTLPPARSPRSGSIPNSPPLIRDIQVTPAQGPLAPPGVDATVAQDGYLGLTVLATDPDGDALVCVWSCSGGVFSSPDQDRMRWDVEQRAWTTTWQWRPPQGAPVGSRYDLAYRVFDARGATGAPLGAAVRTLEVIPTARIAFSRKQGGANDDIFLMNTDGSGLVNLTRTPNVDENLRDVSSDGTWLVYSTGGPSDLYRMYLDGTGVLGLDNDVNWDLSGTISPNRDLVTRVWEPNFPGWELWVTAADGSNSRFVASQDYVGPNGNANSDFSPDGSQIIYNKSVGGTWVMQVVNLDGTGDTPLPVGPGRNWSGNWAADGWIWFNSDRDGNTEIYKVRPDGTGLSRMTVSPTNEGGPATSMDGSRVLFTSAGDIQVMNSDGSGLQTLTSGRGDSRPAWVP
ncbi:MAG: hypothetical protein AB1758_36170, partial [Candidatus Eremiobacterota bacterium]